MPSRGPDGKPLSGAALRKRKQQQDAAARAREAKRKKLAVKPAPAAASPTPPAATGLDFATLPAPPLGDPMSAMGWWNDVLLVCADQVLRDPALGLERRVKFLADFSAKAGMIRDKSAESKAIRDALRQKAKAAEDAGLERAGSPPPQVPRPAG